MPRDGCKQCSRRRIRCDKTEPHCQKCIAKGLECSGYGVDYRFAADVAASRQSSKQNKPPNGRRLQLKNHGTVQRRAPSIASETRESSANSLSLSPISWTNSTHTSTSRSASPSHYLIGRVPELSVSSWQWPHPANDLAIEGLKPGISHLFSHFSSTIASIMVTFDRGSNGYRNIILPLAHQDELVQRAVCVVSAFHIGRQDPSLYATAEAGRTAIISKLSQSARHKENASDVFNLSTLVTLLVLLVGEMVTGSTEFNHLYSMMTALLQGSNILQAASPSVETFLMQQVHMWVYLGRMAQLARGIVDMALRFQLFVRPFLDPDPGAVMLKGNIKQHLDFITCFSDCGPWYSAQVSCLEDAVQLAKDIYLEDYNGEHHPTACHVRLERLRDMTSSITLTTPGMHALVWPYFVAAASSRSQGQREYFVFKLREIHQKTPMNNILIAIERLEEIWERFPSGGWTRCLGRFRPILAV
ncbi:hypothetical protein D0859_08381 [Hortaea werneckii]|uniref:Zn(2)-C6 fungal-type domain-containing protein n=1 Tax=Hortaea werneckii TaxID=91943 RepID=A0A3M7IQC4_HORWE|nr:hypothetical protein D0859_08381 [Hortaea werneckii]